MVVVKFRKLTISLFPLLFFFFFLRSFDIYLVKNIWKSYIWTADKDVNESDPRSNLHYLGSSEKKNPVQAWIFFFQALFSLLPK